MTGPAGPMPFPVAWQNRAMPEPSVVAIRPDGADLTPEHHGAKACGLQRLMRLGLAVPDAVVIPVTDSSDASAGGFGPFPAGPLAVRSGAAVSLPGAFDTLLGVEPGGLADAIAAVVASRRSRRARTIARALGHDDVPPTAVIVQTLVDTTVDDRSGAGVATSADPVTGEAGLRGSFAWRVRGDAVMGGTVPVEPVEALHRLPAVSEQLTADMARLHDELGPVEVEFAVASGRLWYLQLRELHVGVVPGARPAAVGPEVALGAVLGRGRPAGPGLAAGELHTDVDEALDAIAAGRPVVIALETTSPGDVEVMVGAAAVVTVLGGPESHAAVVARGAGVPAVVSVGGLRVHPDGIELPGGRVDVGEPLVVDGTGGRVGRPG